MSDPSRSPLADLLGFTGRLEIADIGAADITEPAPYKVLLDKGLGRLNAFEADPRHHPKLRETFGADLALFSEIVGDGSVQTLHLADPDSGMTSLLKPSARNLAFFNGFSHFGEVFGTETVTTTRLDDVAGLPDIDYLKMDIQGAELQVLAGGTHRLARCGVIQLEVSFVPLYENQPTFAEIDSWMRAQGYLPHCFTEVKRWSIDPIRRNNNVRMPFNQLLEADIVYVKDPVFLERWDPELLVRIALIAHHCYRSPDLTGHLIRHLEDRGVLPKGGLDAYVALVNQP